MLAQDSYGYLHDIPDTHLQQAAPHVLFDGLGNPVGQLGDLFDFLKPIGQVLTAPLQAAGSIVSHALPAVGNLLQAPLQMATAPLQMAGGLLSNLLPHPSAPMPAPPPQMPMQAYGGIYPGTRPELFTRPTVTVPQGGMPHLTPPHHPWPLGWMRPNLPYTGLGPQRLYMRCAVWPGPAGLVPGPQMPTGPWPGPGGPGAPSGGFPGGGGFHHRRHTRHRRR
jgi:hypothetical protein